MNIFRFLPDFALRGLMIMKLHAYRENQLLYAAAVLKISDYLENGGKTADELAELTNTHRDSLYRVLRACAGLGLYKEKNGKFYLTRAGKFFISDNPDSVSPVAIMRGEDSTWKAWGELLYAVKTGESAFQKAFGMNLFEYLNKNPESGEAFNKSMRIFTQYEIPMILKAYNFSGFRKIVDIAGGNGLLLTAILEKHRKCRGVLFDLPPVIKDAKEYLSGSEMKDNIKIEPGDIFVSIPPGGDCYILKRILHDWNDDEAIKILENCRKAIIPGGKLLIIEYVITGRNIAGMINDIQMMVMCPGGKERTREEFVRLVNRAGFRLNKIIGKKGVSILECLPEKNNG